MINASSKIRLYINNQEYTDYLIEGSLSDDSAYTSNIITTKGTIVLGGDTSILDFKKTLFPIGSKVTIYATLANGELAKLPRGHVYVLNSSINVNERLTTLEVGCSLAFLTSREAHYEDEIKTLIEDSFDSNFKSSFVIDEYNLSTLDSLLKTAGKCIFQDKHGYVQDMNQFGNDGLGSNFTDAKLVSFDKETAINIEALGGAIEELPSAVFVEVDIDVPDTDNQDGEGQDGKPEPFISSELERTIDYTDAERETFDIKNDPGSSDATTEAVPNCGSIEDPGEPQTPDFAYTVTGKAVTVQRTKKERVTSGSYTRYDGPGNQVDWEYNFEYCSALTYAGDIINTVVGKYAEIANAEAEKAKGLLSKVNQYYATAKDFNERDLTGKSQAEIDKIQNAYKYYTCHGEQLYAAAENISGAGFVPSAGEGSNGVARKATEFVDRYTRIYGMSNLNSTYYTYGEGDVLVKKVELKYIHIASSQAAQETTANLQTAYKWNAYLSGYRYQIAYDIDFAGYRTYRGGRSSFDATVDGSQKPTAHDDDIFQNPESYHNQFLKSKTTTTYDYGSNYTTEVVLYEDFEDPDNNYKRINYSSSGSKNPEESDRIEIERDGNGCIYVNGRSDSEPLNLSSTVTIDGAGGTVSAGWLGVPSSTTKTISIPATFAPVAKKNCNGIIYNPNMTSIIARYQSIVEKYARNEAKRIAGDNFGYRITETGTRAEIFGYYPYYPISLMLTSVGKQYRLRTAASNWVFDSSNVICSFDAFNVGEPNDIDGSILPSTSDFTDTQNIGSSTTETLDDTFFNLPENGSQIEVTALPSGVTLTNNGVTVNVGDTITAADITAGNVTATTDASTTNVFVSYVVIKNNGDNFTVIDDLFPNGTVTYVENPFADGGEFTNNTTNGGSNADAGEFTTNTNGSGVSLNAGDFDTGAEVLQPEPLEPSSASTSNNSVNPETQSGVNLVDGAGTSIGSSNLPAPHGTVDPVLDVVIDFAINNSIKLRLDTVIQPQSGWDYGYVNVSFGTSIDMGSVASPNTFNADFGTVASANEPSLASSVV